MKNKYIIAIDQSTSGTKALVFDSNGIILGRKDVPHKQIISKEGYVSHNPLEIYENVIKSVNEVITDTGIDKDEIAAAAISNQRETALVFDRVSKMPVADAVVWQCSRGAAICEELSEYSDTVKKLSGLTLSPYFSAAKIAWILRHHCKKPYDNLCAGTMDSWLVFKLTGGEHFRTDYSNAARTQIFNIDTLKFDEELCNIFDIPISMMPEVCESNSVFGYTDFEGILSKKIPIYSVMGDSNGALFGQKCHTKGMVKATYGTGSSVMMNIGEKRLPDVEGLSSSLAWKMNGKTNYVFEGNINYTGSVIKWLVDDLKLISSSKESGALAMAADKNDKTYLVPAFTGLGAPYFDSNAKCIICGISRTTGKNEIVKAAENSIAYQINDVAGMMAKAGVPIAELRADGGPTKDKYLMQFQSDIIGADVLVPSFEELSAIGVAYAAGIACGLYTEEIFNNMQYKKYSASISESERSELTEGWNDAVKRVMK